MTPDERRTCLAALEAAERAAEALRAVLGAEAGSKPPTVSLAVACRAWGISKEAGLKRLHREPGLGRKVAGRWRVPIEAARER